jgi:hypothetical protein
MDGQELEEGITWKELFQVLKDRRRAGSKVEMKDENGSGRYALCAMPFASFNKEDATTWVDLLLLLDSERSFFNLKKDSGRRILVEKEKSSKKVIDYFLEKAWQRPIVKSHPSTV